MLLEKLAIVEKPVRELASMFARGMKNRALRAAEPGAVNAVKGSLERTGRFATRGQNLTPFDSALAENRYKTVMPRSELHRAVKGQFKEPQSTLNMMRKGPVGESNIRDAQALRFDKKKYYSLASKAKELRAGKLQDAQKHLDYYGESRYAPDFKQSGGTVTHTRSPEGKLVKTHETEGSGPLYDTKGDTAHKIAPFTEANKGRKLVRSYGGNPNAKPGLTARQAKPSERPAVEYGQPARSITPQKRSMLDKLRGR